MTELTLTTGAAANGGSCVARHDGRVVFVRYALPGETVRARVLDERGSKGDVTDERGSYWHAEAFETMASSGYRVDSLWPISWQIRQEREGTRTTWRANFGYSTGTAPARHLLMGPRLLAVPAVASAAPCSACAAIEARPIAFANTNFDA